MIQLDMYESKAVEAGWLCGPAQCLVCGWEWVAVWPLGAGPLECKQCGSADTVRESTERPP